MEHLEVIPSCPICGGEKFTTFLTCLDHSVSGKEFTIAECGSCGFRFTNPRPRKEHIQKYYESDDYISHSGTRRGLVNFMYHLVRQHTLLRKLKLIGSLAAKGRLLDIGCGTGEFLDVSRRAGWQTRGMEPGQKAREFAASRYNLEIVDEAGMSGFPPAGFDVITMWHVLEHVHELNERLAQIGRLLGSGGHIVIAVPNNDSYDVRHYGTHWAAYDVPRHLYHFTAASMSRLLGNHGLKIVRILPMPFDAFYVSMLSEQYRKGKKPSALLAGLYRGLLSNLSAITGRGGYSSQIFLVSK